MRRFGRRKKRNKKSEVLSSFICIPGFVFAESWRAIIKKGRRELIEIGPLGCGQLLRAGSENLARRVGKSQHSGKKWPASHANSSIFLSSLKAREIFESTKLSAAN